MNLAIRGIEADLGKFNADTFFNDCHPQLKADFIMANPPFNLSGWGADKLVDDVRWQYGTPPAGNANFAWLQHMIWHLAPNGRIGMVLANGSLSSQSGGEGEIRKNIINADLVDCIVAMPTQLFYTTQIPVSLVTIEASPENLCYRLPIQLSEWAKTLVSMANAGDDLLPAEVVFTKAGNRIYADII